MKTVSAREANQSFSKLLGEAARGEEVIITKRGKPVAKLVSVTGSDKGAEWEEARDRLMKRLRRGVDLGGIMVSREEIYDR